MHILGLSAFYHDSAACLLHDGAIVAAAEEERFSRKKHDAAFPAQAAAYCLREAGIDASELELVVFYEKPLLKFDRLLESYLAYAPRGFKLARLGLPLWLEQRLHLPREIDRGLGGRYRGRYVFTEHHEAHAASGYYSSPIDTSALMSIDWETEWASRRNGTGSGAVGGVLGGGALADSLGVL